MKEPDEASRRGFIKKLAATAAAVTVGNSLLAADKPGTFHYLKQEYNHFGPNDQVNRFQA
jgi:hypothetical protein